MLKSSLMSDKSTLAPVWRTTSVLFKHLMRMISAVFSFSFIMARLQLLDTLISDNLAHSDISQ